MDIWNVSKQRSITNLFQRIAKNRAPLSEDR